MLLEGHGAAVRGVAYSHDGASLASCSDDKTVLLWRQQGEEIGSYAQLAGHKGAVVRVGWGAGSERVLSASADKTARAWDAETGLQVKKMAEHGSFVNDVSAARCVQCMSSGAGAGRGGGGRGAGPTKLFNLVNPECGTAARC